MGTRSETGRHVVALRIARGMTQGELARAAHVHIRTVVRSEQGEPIGQASRDRLAAVLGPLAHDRIAVRAWADSQPPLPADASPALVARYARNLSVGDAAERIGITRHALRRAERGEVIQLRTARAIAGFYGIPVGDVFVIPDSDPADAAVA